MAEQQRQEAETKKSELKLLLEGEYLSKSELKLLFEGEYLSKSRL